MSISNGYRRLAAAVLIGVFGLGTVLQARPLQSFSAFDADEKRPLPAVNWIRSRHIDVIHLDIDLRFDWEKESALGVTGVTFAPFSDTDKFTLDAAMMTINSVKLAGGGPLRFAYDAKKDNDNLEVTLDRVYKAGEVVKVVIDYSTNYVNKAESGDTAIGGAGGTASNGSGEAGGGSFRGDGEAAEPTDNPPPKTPDGGTGRCRRPVQ